MLAMAVSAAPIRLLPASEDDPGPLSLPAPCVRRSPTPTTLTVQRLRFTPEAALGVNKPRTHN